MKAVTHLKDKNHIKTEKKINKNNIDKSLIYEKTENTKDEINEKKIFLQYALKAINSASSIEEANKIFKNILTSKNFLIFKVQNFNNSIQKIVNEFNLIRYNLLTEQSKNIVTKIARTFIGKNMAALKIGYKLPTADYITNKVLNNVYDGNNSQLVAADVLKAEITNNINFSIRNYVQLKNRLKYWLVDNIYLESNKQYINNNEHLSRSNIFYNIKSENHIPYLGQTDSFYTQINILHDRKTALEKKKKDELIILNRRYPVSRKRFASFFIKKTKNILRLNKSSLFSKEDMTLPYGNNITYADKVYKMLNISYNKKYLRLDNEERELIKKYKFRLKNDEVTKKSKQQVKQYIKNLNINLSAFEFWNNKNKMGIKQCIKNSCVNNSEFGNKAIEYILSKTTNRVENLLKEDYIANNNNSSSSEYLTNFNLFRRLSNEETFNNGRLMQVSNVLKNNVKTIVSASSDNSEIDENNS